jgi:pimeloyl-ACP methyl ester carboxylesterase
MDIETRYARSGDVHIAYQIVGDGPFDLVFVPGFVTHLELNWKLPGMAASMLEQGRFSRMIRFDKRGTGMSDPVSGAPTLELRMDDVRAVMDAVGSQRAAFYGVSEGASLAILFAATYPERTAALVVRGGVARTLWAPDYPWGVTEEAYRARIERELRIYGPRPQALEAVRTLGHFDDDEAAQFLDYLRYGASPGMLEALLRMNRDIDIRHVLGAVRVPTLVLHGAVDAIVPRGATEFIAQQIPGAQLQVVEGAGHLAVGAGARRIVTAMREFLAGIWQTGGWDDEPDRALATVLFTDIVGSSDRAVALGDRAWRELLERHNAIVRRELLRYRGTEVDTAGDGFFAAFDGPARAIRCARSVVGALAEIGLDVRAGLHTGECETANGKIAGIAVHTGARVASHAAAGEVVVSSTVRDLVAGSDIEFSDRGTHELKGIPGEWRLYAVTRA